MTWTYLGALAAVGIFVLAGERAIQASLEAEDRSWRNLAELQEQQGVAEQLIQTVLLGSRLDTRPDSAHQRRTSAADLDELLRAWPTIIHHPERTAAEREIAKDLYQVADRARTALQTPLDEAPRETQIAVLRELDDAAELTLKHAALWRAALSSSVAQGQAQIAEGRDRTSVLATLIAALLMLTLVFEGWFLFRPIARKFGLFLRRQHRLLDVTRGYEQRARELAQTKESFLANISHEIRTPLHGVLGMTDLLERTDLDQRQSEYIETIQSCGRSLLHLVDDVLDLAKLEAGEVQPEAIEFKPRALIESVLEVVSPTLHPGVDIFFVEDSSLHERLIGDPERLRQVLTNLASNASKFTLQGEIVIVARCLKTARPDSNQPLTRLEIEVQDSGIGLPEGPSSRLFCEFTQADASTTRKHGGTGLGLSICRQLCIAMGGEITAEPRESGGSTFSFTVKVGLAESHALAPQSHQKSALHGKNLLCVDSHPLGRRLLREKLERSGALVDCCADVEDVVPRLTGARLAKVSFDAIVFDDREGNLDLGLTLRALRERSLRPGIVVIDPLQPPPEGFNRVSVSSAEHVSRPLREGTLCEALSRTLKKDVPMEKDTTVSPPLPAAPPQETLQGVDATPYRILVAEDNAVNQKIAVITLERLGCNVQVVTDGKTAVKEARKRCFDMIFMDCQMPIMDGFDATRAIRKEEPRGMRVPIVALTANVFAEDRERCLEAGMDAFLPKPVTSGELREILDRFASKERVQEKRPAGL